MPATIGPARRVGYPAAQRQPVSRCSRAAAAAWRASTASTLGVASAPARTITRPATAVGRPDAGGAELARLRRAGVDAVRHPGPPGQPADLLELLDRAPAEALHAVGVLVRVLGEMGVQPHIESLGKLGGAPHELGADAERGARGER